MSRHGKVQQCKAGLGFKLLNKVARFFKMATKHSIVETLTFLAIMAALYIVWCQKSITYSHLLLFIVRFELKLQCVHPKDCSLTLIWKIGFWWAMAFGSSVMILSIQSYLLLMKRKWTLGRFFGLWYLGARKHTPELHIHSLNKLWRFKCRFTAPYRLMRDKSLSFQRRVYIQCGFVFFVPRESEQLYKFKILFLDYWHEVTVLVKSHLLPPPQKVEFLDCSLVIDIFWMIEKIACTLFDTKPSHFLSWN